MDLLTLFSQIEPLIVASIPIVVDIAKLIPSRTFKEVADAYAQMGVPLARVTVSSNDPQVRGGVAMSIIENLMMNLAVAILQKLHPGVSTAQANVAVNMAVASTKPAVVPAGK